MVSGIHEGSWNVSPADKGGGYCISAVSHLSVHKNHLGSLLKVWVPPPPPEVWGSGTTPLTNTQVILYKF